MKSTAFRLKSRIEWRSSLRRLGCGAVLGYLVTSVVTVVVAVRNIHLVRTYSVLILGLPREALVLD